MNNKKSLAGIFISILSVMILGGYGISNFAQAAGTAALYLSPASASLQQGSNISVQIRLNTGTEAVNAVNGSLTYPTDKLEFISVSGGGSAFGIEASNSGGGGSVTIERGSISNVTGNVLVATVVFKAISSNTIATVLFDQSALAASNGNDVTGSKTGAAYVLTAISTPPPAPSPTPAPGPSPTPAPSPTPSPKTTSKPPATTTPTSQPPSKAKIISTDVKDVSYKKVSVQIMTDKPVSSYIKYGIDESFTISTPLGKKEQNPVHTISGAALTPGVKYFYKAILVQDDGTETESEVGAFTTEGYNITIKIVDKNNRPVANKKVIIRSNPKESKTNNKGEVSFAGMTPGKHELEIFNGKISSKDSVNIQDNLRETNGVFSSEPQAFSIKLATIASKSEPPVYIYGLIVGLAVAVIVSLARGAVKRHTRSREFIPPAAENYTNTPGAEPVGTIIEPTYKTPDTPPENLSVAPRPPTPIPPSPEAEPQPTVPPTTIDSSVTTPQTIVKPDSTTPDTAEKPEDNPS